MKRLALLLGFALLFGPRSAQAAPFILNPSFETGDFTNWMTSDLADPFFPLSVEGAGANTFDWPWDSTPTHGSFTAFSGFDGAGPGTITIAQDVTIPSGNTTIRFDYRAAWDLFEFGAAADRLFNVNIQPSGGGANLFSQNILTAEAGTIVNDTGNLVGAVDLSAFAGQSVRLVFELEVPENFTGPAQFQLDNIRVAPEPSTLLLLAAGAAVACRRMRKAKTGA
jgi:hypothetical protein